MTDLTQLVLATAIALLGAALAIASATRSSVSQLSQARPHAHEGERAPRRSLWLAALFGVIPLVLAFYAIGAVWKPTVIFRDGFVVSSPRDSFGLVVQATSVFLVLAVVLLKVPRLRPAGRVVLALLTIATPLFVLLRSDGEGPPELGRGHIWTSPALGAFLPDRAAFSGPCGRSFVDASGATKLWLHCGHSLERDETPSWIEATSMSPAGPVLVRVCPTTELGRSPTACTVTLLPSFDAETYVPGVPYVQGASGPYKWMSKWGVEAIADNVDLSIHFEPSANLWMVESEAAPAGLFDPPSPTQKTLAYDAKSFSQATGTALLVDTRPPHVSLAFLLPAAALVLAAALLRRRAMRRARAIESGRIGALVEGRVTFEGDPKTRTLASAPPVGRRDGPIVWMGEHSVARATGEAGYRETAFVQSADLLYGDRDLLVTPALQRAERADLAVLAIVAALVLPFALTFAVLQRGGAERSYLSFGVVPRAASPAPTGCPSGMHLFPRTELTTPSGILRVPAFCADSTFATAAQYASCVQMNKCTPADLSTPLAPAQAEAFCGAQGKSFESDEEARVRTEQAPGSRYTMTLPVAVEGRASPFVIAPGCEIACGDGPRCGGNPSCWNAAVDPLAAARAEPTSLRCVTSPTP